MYVKCCVPGCTSRREHVLLHKFPKSKKRVQKWLDFINCDALRQLPMIDLMGRSVCHKHFEKRFVSQKSHLLCTAYPTLFSDSEMTSGIPLKQVKETVNPLEEHRYVKRIHEDHNYFNQDSHDSVISKQTGENIPPTNENQEDTICDEKTDKSKHKRRRYSNVSQNLRSTSPDKTSDNESSEINNSATATNTVDIQYVMNDLPGSDNFSYSVEGVIIDNILSPVQMLDDFNAKLNSLPVFDPSNKQLRIDDWIDKMEEFAVLYEWSDEQLLDYAIPKLSGLAKIWYDSICSLDYNWLKCKKELLKQFPAYDNYAQILREMLETKAALKESLELYYQDKIKLLNRCDITGKKAVDCLLDGIEDKELLYRAQVACYSEPEELLDFFKSVKIKDPNFQYNLLEIPMDNSETLNNPNQLNLPETPNEKCIVPIAVNCHPTSCCVDFNSHNTLIRVTDFIELDIPYSTDDLPLLYGLDGFLIEPLGKAIVDIQVQTVKTSIEVFIVADELLNYPILLGRNFIEQAGVLMVKTDERMWTGY